MYDEKDEKYMRFRMSFPFSLKFVFTLFNEIRREFAAAIFYPTRQQTSYIHILKQGGGCSDTYENDVTYNNIILCFSESVLNSNSNKYTSMGEILCVCGIVGWFVSVIRGCMFYAGLMMKEGFEVI